MESHPSLPEKLHNLPPEVVQPALLETLFGQAPIGLAIFDLQMVLLRCNTTWAEFIDRYTPTQLKDVIPGKRFSELAPGAEQFFAPVFERVLGGEMVQLKAMRSVSGGIESFWDVTFSPVYEGGQIVGVLDVTTDATERVLAQHRLEQRVEERTRELQRRREIAESMRDIIKMINSNMPLDAFLEQAVELAVQRMEAEASILHKFDFENRQLVYIASYHMPLEFSEGYVRSFDTLTTSGTIEYLNVIAQGKPAYGNYPPHPENIADVEKVDNSPLDLTYQRLAIRKAFAGSLAVPLSVQNSIYGAMVFYYVEPQEFTEEQVQLAMAFADQVSLAIENAQLHAQVEENAILAERNRLARELHDAVTQTLFSTSLIAEVLPRLWERDQAEGLKRLEELRTLTRGALAEMRTLLLELRPSALMDAELNELLRHLANAFAGRSRLPIHLMIEGTPLQLPPQVKITFYRITQEALNNISKHAEASQVEMKLHWLPASVDLSISDDGRGFDPGLVPSERLGVGIMQERAASIGAQFSIHSAPGKGTQLLVSWQANVSPA